MFNKEVMKIINYYRNIEKIKNSEIKQFKKGRWFHWRRIFVLRTQDEYTVVSVNFFDRMARIFLNLLCMDYFHSFGNKKIFNDKKIKLISCKQLDKKISKFSEISKKTEKILQEPIEKECSNNEIPWVPDLLAEHYEEMKKIPCPIARDTGLAIIKGAYTSPTGKIASLSSGAQLLKESQCVQNSILECSINPRHNDAKVEVINQDCLDAAEEELKNGAKKVAVLMLASPIEPGGAMEEGNNGQEEDLCRRSTIFGFMWDQAHITAETILYNLVDVTPHQVNPEYSSMTNNKMIHVPGVTVFRSGKKENYKFLEMPFEVGMLVSPGLDRPSYKRENGKTQFVRTEDEEQLTKLIMTHLKVS